MVDILLIKTNLDLQSNKLIRWILVPTTVEVTNGVEAQYHPEVAKSLIESGKVAPIQIMHQLKYLHRLEKDQTQGHLSEQVICVKTILQKHFFVCQIMLVAINHFWMFEL